MIVYSVTAQDSDNAIYTENKIFTDKDYAHSSHLTVIMRSLDDSGLDLVSIDVVARG